MIGAVHFVKAVIINLPDHRFTVDIELSEVVLAIRIVAFIPTSKGRVCSTYGSNLLEFLGQATGCDDAPVPATALGAKLIVQMSMR